MCLSAGTWLIYVPPLSQLIVDAHTAHECLKGEEEPSFWYRITFSSGHQEQATLLFLIIVLKGSKGHFSKSGIIITLVQSTDSSGQPNER